MRHLPGPHTCVGVCGVTREHWSPRHAFPWCSAELLRAPLLSSVWRTQPPSPPPPPAGTGASSAMNSYPESSWKQRPHPLTSHQQLGGVRAPRGWGCRTLGCFKGSESRGPATGQAQTPAGQLHLGLHRALCARRRAAAGDAGSCLKAAPIWLGKQIKLDSPGTRTSGCEQSRWEPTGQEQVCLSGRLMGGFQGRQLKLPREGSRRLCKNSGIYSPPRIHAHLQYDLELLPAGDKDYLAGPWVWAGSVTLTNT